MNGNGEQRDCAPRTAGGNRYLHGTQIDQVIADENATGQVLWALADNQGTVRDVVDSTGVVVNYITYDSFGGITSQSNPTASMQFGYTGREFDEETGQYYYRARYYDAAVGEFISEDPIGFEAGDANLYRYTGNSPINRVDPFGEDWYGTLNRVDQFVAGFGDAVTFGGTTQIRKALYGDTATRNHTGGLFTAGQVTGVVASVAVGVGAAGNGARGGLWATRAAKAYTVVGDAVGVYQSTSNLLRGCFQPTDLLGFAPVAGFAAGRLGRGLEKIDEFPLYRRVINTGPYQSLEVPLQLRSVKKSANKAGIGLSGIKVRIIREPETIGYLYGYTHPNGRRIDLYPSAFENYETLVKTLGHERTHVFQVKISGPTTSTTELSLRETAARNSEGLWWDYYQGKNPFR